MEENKIIEWVPDLMLEVTLREPDDFLKVRETLTRIGVASRKEKKLFQSCHILHKQGRYFIVHFKELFLLDGKKANLEENDIGRRNTISVLMSDWGLIEIVNKESAKPLAPLKLSHSKKKTTGNYVRNIISEINKRIGAMQKKYSSFLAKSYIYYRRAEYSGYT